MNSVIYNPLEEFDSKFRDKHSENTNKFFPNTLSSYFLSKVLPIIDLSTADA